MFWVSAITRQGNRLGLMVQGKDAHESAASMKDLRFQLPFEPDATAVLELSLHEASEFPTDDYLRALGACAYGADAQACRRFLGANGDIIIPDQLLVVGLVGASSLMRAALLSPHGPTALTTTYFDGAVRTVLTPNRNLRFQADRKHAMERMAWVGCYRTAWRAWSSVLEHAQRGRLGITLPTARVRCELRGRIVEGRLLVTSLQVLWIEPHEEAHAFCQGRALRRFQTSELSLPDSWPRSTPLQRMSDVQWVKLEQALETAAPHLLRAQRSHSLRDRFEAIRLSLHSATSFYSLRIEPSLREAARVLWRRLQERESWPALRDALEATLEA